MALKITNRLPAVLSGVQRKGVRAITKAIIIGASNASVKTPMDTSTLLNSQRRKIESIGDIIKGTCSYGEGEAVYAAYVHDPNVKQTFRRATAEKEFLKRGFEEAKSLIDAAVLGEMRL